MAWTSMNEDIQDRRDEAEYFRRTGVVVANTAQEAPPPVEAVEVAPEPEETPAERARLRKWIERCRLSRGKYVWTRDTVILRGGEQRWTGKIRDVLIRTFDRGGPNGALQIDFKMWSKGGGQTHVSGRFGSEDFHALMQGMVAANRQVALQVMADVLAQNRN